MQADATAMQDKGPGANPDKRTIAAVAMRRQIMTATLSLAGEVGFGKLTVDKVIARAGCGRSTFYTHFPDVAVCFAAAYEREAEGLCKGMIDAIAGAGDWRDAVRAALTELFRFVAERRQIASALFRELYSAEGSRRKHDEVVERLIAAIEGTCTRPAGRAPTFEPIAPTFVVGAVEGVVCSRLARGDHEQLPGTLPELMYLIVSLLDDRAAARDELVRQEE